MDNSCLIIMPPGEPTGYPDGHFNRVYEYVIVPACRKAGYWPLRADQATSDQPLDILKKIIDCAVAICDLSANNANALYGLAVRHALDLPVTLIKDRKSVVMFDADELGQIEYDESLRIDTVQKAIDVLGDALKKSADTKKGRHTLLNRLSIGLPQFTPSAASFEPAPPAPIQEAAPAVEEAEPRERRMPIISPLPDYVGDPFTESEVDKLKAGDELFHLHHGKGKVNFVKKTGKDKLANIQFESGPNLLVLGATDFFRRVAS